MNLRVLKEFCSRRNESLIGFFKFFGIAIVVCIFVVLITIIGAFCHKYVIASGRCTSISFDSCVILYFLVGSIAVLFGALCLLALFLVGAGIFFLVSYACYHCRESYKEAQERAESN